MHRARCVFKFDLFTGVNCSAIRRWCRVAVAAAETSNADDVAVQGSPRRTRVDSADASEASSEEKPRDSGSAAVARGAVYPPRSVFRPTPRNITVSPGDRAVLKCRVENLGTKTVSPLYVHNINLVSSSFIGVDSILLELPIRRSMD